LRRQSHYQHKGTSTPVKYLFEAIMRLKITPAKKYHIHHVTLFNIIDPSDIKIAEHAGSILCSAYTRWGELSGTLAGGGNVVSMATKNSRQAWANSCNQILSTGTYLGEKETVDNDLKGRMLIQQYPDEGSELTVWRGLKAQIALDEKEADEHAAKVYRDVGYFLHGKVWKRSKQLQEIQLKEDIIKLDKIIDAGFGEDDEDDEAGEDAGAAAGDKPS
jgi:hypothetical protein